MVSEPLSANPWLKKVSRLASTIARAKANNAEYVNLFNSDIKNLTVLQGMSIKKLNIGWTSISDLSPLKDMPIEEITIQRTNVVDLSPLQGKLMNMLAMEETPVSENATPAWLVDDCFMIYGAKEGNIRYGKVL